MKQENGRQPWFTVEQIDTATWAISEYGHWEQPHSYLAVGEHTAALIDTGLGAGDMAAVVRGLTSLPIEVVLTHAHWDHIGGCRQFERIAVHWAEAPWLAGAFPLPDAAVRQQLTRDPCVFPEGFDPARYTVYQGGATRLLSDGDLLDLGGRRLTVLHTPGHSPGHLCLWEEARGLLFAGDLLYHGMLDAWYPSTDPVAFARSAARLRGLPVRRLLPGHFSLEVSPTLVTEVADAFAGLDCKGLLHHGAGVFTYDGFSIHL